MLPPKKKGKKEINESYAAFKLFYLTQLSQKYHHHCILWLMRMILSKMWNFHSFSSDYILLMIVITW